MILLRHGQTIFNQRFSKDRIDPGVPDPPLTDLGRRQALTATEALVTHSITRIIASPYTRAIETAEIVARRLWLLFEIDSDIRERAGYSCDIGTHPLALAQRWPHLNFSDLSTNWWAYTDGCATAEGLDEPESALTTRVARFRERIARRNDWAETLAVCHWGPIRAMIGKRVENGSFVRHDPRALLPMELFL